MHRSGLAGAILVAAALLAGPDLLAAERHAMRGLVLAVDPSHRSFVVSHDSVPGVMPAMAMPFDVREPKELAGVVPGMMVEFTLVLEPDGTTAQLADLVETVTNRR